MYISEIRTKAPADERMPLERKFYDTLEKLKIPYEQVDNDPASSMEECAEYIKQILIYVYILYHYEKIVSTCHILLKKEQARNLLFCFKKSLLH